MSILLKGLLELVFPKKCVVCGGEGKHLCKQCQPRLAGAVVGREWRRTDLDGLTAVFEYKDPAVRKVVEAIKFGFNRELIGELGLGRARLSGVDLVVPVPLHWFRQNWRGFNQAEELARKIGGKKVVLVLKRMRNTRQQAKIEHPKERRENVRGAFRVVSGKEVRGKRILLVDDVLTTGESMKACVRELRKARAKKVWGWVLAR